MIRWLCTLAAAAVLTGFAFLLVTGHYMNDGRVIVRVNGNLGVHLGDLFVMAGWVVGMLALAGLHLSSRARITR